MLLGYVVISAALAATGLVLVHLLGGVARADERVNVWVAAHRSGLENSFSHWGTFAANTLAVVTVAAIATVLLLWRRAGRAAALPAVGLILELAAFLTVNETVRRPRPRVPHLDPTPGTFSFPSGHSAATLVLYGAIALVVTWQTTRWLARALAWAAAVVVPLWVSCSRVYEGQHHPLDVIAGLIMGAAVLAWTAWALGLVGNHRQAEASEQAEEAVPLTRRDLEPAVSPR